MRGDFLLVSFSGQLKKVNVKSMQIEEKQLKQKSERKINGFIFSSESLILVHMLRGR